MYDKIHVALLQMSSSDDVLANMERVRFYGAQLQPEALLVLPEMWSFLVPDTRGDERAAFAQKYEKSLRLFLSELAKERKITVVGGSSFEWNEETQKVHNRCRVFGPNGHEIAQYDKIHLFDNGFSENSFMESRSISAGSQPVIAALEHCQLGLSICYDLRFPKLYAHYGDCRVEAVAAPSAFAAKTGKDHWELLVRTRAIENQCFVWAANQCGLSPAGVKCWGHSLIVDPWGIICAEGGEEEGLVQAECNLRKVAQVRQLMPVLDHRKALQLQEPLAPSQSKRIKSATKSKPVAVKKVILASRSRERLAILKELGLNVVAIPMDFDERIMPGENAEHLVARLAVAKAHGYVGNSWVIAADTVVVHGDDILGKPENLTEARKMLWAMSGQTIKVFTGSALRSPRGKMSLHLDNALLQMCTWTEASLHEYLNTGLWQNRAGGFSMGHTPCPVELLEGSRDVVRGLNSEFVNACLKRN